MRLAMKTPNYWSELSSGGWVDSNTNVPFCSLRTDEALEQENRKIKVLGGVVNITQRKSALTRVFSTFSLQWPKLGIIAKPQKLKKY